jgi:hypothetical protein
MRIAAICLALAAAASCAAQCRTPVFVHWSYSFAHDQEELSDWWGHDGQNKYPDLCQADSLEKASYILVLTRSAYSTSNTVRVPHQERQRVDATISTWYGNATLHGYATVTQYEITQVPVQCDVVSAFLYPANSPYPTAYAQRVYTSGTQAFFANLGAGLAAGSGGSVPLTACDLGSRKPVKDSVNSVLRFATPIQGQLSKQNGIVSATDFNGTYSGNWRSSRFTASGTVQMVINISEGEVRAEISLTGSALTSTVLYGKAAENPSGWEVSLRSANGALLANGTFQNGEFAGTYDYPQAGDQGRWALVKQ